MCAAVTGLLSHHIHHATIITVTGSRKCLLAKQAWISLWLPTLLAIGLDIQGSTNLYFSKFCIFHQYNYIPTFVNVSKHTQNQRFVSNVLQWEKACYFQYIMLGVTHCRLRAASYTMMSLTMINGHKWKLLNNRSVKKPVSMTATACHGF